MIHTYIHTELQGSLDDIQGIMQLRVACCCVSPAASLVHKMQTVGVLAKWPPRSTFCRVRETEKKKDGGFLTSAKYNKETASSTTGFLLAVDSRRVIHQSRTACDVCPDSSVVTWYLFCPLSTSIPREGEGKVCSVVLGQQQRPRRFFGECVLLLFVLVLVSVEARTIQCD